MDDFTPEAITSPDILAVTAKIDVQNDPALDRGDQGIEPARVEITMNDGAVFASRWTCPPVRPAARWPFPTSSGSSMTSSPTLGSPSLRPRRGNWWRRSPGSSEWMTCKT